MFGLPRIAVFDEQNPVADFLTDGFIKFNHVWNKFVGDSVNIKIQSTLILVFNQW